MSLLSTILMYLVYAIVVFHDPLENIVLLSAITPFIYIGGIPGYLLWYILQLKNVSNVWINVICFILLGEAYALILATFLPFEWILNLITVIGSVSFFLPQLIKTTSISQVFAVGGLLVAIPLCLKLLFV